MPPGIVAGLPALLTGLVQSGLVERGFHDTLVPQLNWRQEARFEEWMEHSGTEMWFTRPGLMPVVYRPTPAATDPLPQTAAYEQWLARLVRYTGSVDTHMPTSSVSIANQFMENIKNLGSQAGRSINQVARNELFRPYLSGNTVLTAAGGNTDTVIAVASLNGFTDTLIPALNTRPLPVSSTAPLEITIVGVTGTRNVIGAVPDNPDDPYGPGRLLLDAQLGSAPAARNAVLSSQRAFIIRSGGGASVDALVANDTFLLQDTFTAVSYLRKNNVPPHEDGYYHGHITPDANGQIFNDPIFQRLNQSLPDGARYRDGFLGSFSGVLFYLENVPPDYTNTGGGANGDQLLATGTNALYGAQIGAEVRNEAGVNVGRTIITGRGALYERGYDQSHYVSEAGLNGKIGSFEITQNGMKMSTDRIDLILRAPLNRLQDIVSSSWSITTSFSAPSDALSGTSQARYKRAVVIESAMDS